MSRLLCWLGLHARILIEGGRLRPSNREEGPSWILVTCNRDGCPWGQWEEDLDG